MRRLAILVLCAIFGLVLTFSLAQGTNEGQNYVVKEGRVALARFAPELGAEVVAIFSPGQVVKVQGTVDGASVSGSTLWYRVDANQAEAFVHSSALQAIPITIDTTAPDTTPNVLTNAAPDVPSTLLIEGIGVASAPSDIAVIEFGIERIGSVEDVVYQNTLQAAQDIMDALDEQNFELENIRISSLSLNVEDVVDTAGRVTGEFVYRSQLTLKIVTIEMDQMQQVINVALTNGANALYSMQFSLQDLPNLEDLAREEALARTQEKASQIANQMGIILGNPVTITETNVTISDTDEPLVNYSNDDRVSSIMTVPKVTATVTYQVEYVFRPIGSG